MFDWSQFWSSFWRGVFTNARGLGLTRSRFLLFFLLFLGALMAMHGIHPGWCIAFVVVGYCLEKSGEVVKALMEVRNRRQQVTVERARFAGFITRMKQELITTNRSNSNHEDDDEYS